MYLAWCWFGKQGFCFPHFRKHTRPKPWLLASSSSAFSSIGSLTSGKGPRMRFGRTFLMCLWSTWEGQGEGALTKFRPQSPDVSLICQCPLGEQVIFTARFMLRFTKYSAYHVPIGWDQNQLTYEYPTILLNDCAVCGATSLSS